MELILKTLAQMPLVALFAYLWWINRRDLMKEIDFYKTQVNDKDAQIKEFIKVFDKMNFTLELIKELIRTNNNHK